MDSLGSSAVLSDCLLRPPSLSHKHALTRREWRARPASRMRTRTSARVKIALVDRGKALFQRLMSPLVREHTKGGGSGALAGGLGFGFFWVGGGLSLREQSSRSPSERLSVSAHLCFVEQLRHALGDAALVARQHRNVGGRVSCP